MSKKYKKTVVIFAVILNLLAICACGQTIEGNHSLEPSSSVTVSVSDKKEGLTVSADGVGTDGDKDTDKSDDVLNGGEEDMRLYECVEASVGARTGCAVTFDELKDEGVWKIITENFNCVTFGNELKPDCLFGYSNSNCPGKETITFNGEELVVPTMTFNRADTMLEKIKEYNAENPDRQIKVRGHVLVWHSQTPEWFFHEDYNTSKPYVDIDTMNKRLEWYICNVLTRYTGEDSPYNDMFYGWDVVNEAVSDAGGYRTDTINPNEPLLNSTHNNNSSWWHVYQSNEYIINAFKYANKYAPENLELYYNDYNECEGSKMNTICELLTEIKANEGEPGVGTRISAMGMQGHYEADDRPSGDKVSYAIEKYARIVGNVQITEFDIKENTAYDDIEAENEKIRKRYNILYYYMRSAASKPDVNLTGITFWGTIDNYSWLQTRSDIGGGNKSGLSQHPLLFDENYEPKTCFDVFAKVY